MPDKIRGRSQYFLISARRGDLSDTDALKPEAIRASKLHTTIAEEHFILGIAAQGRKTFVTIIREATAQARVMSWGALSKAIAGDDHDSDTDQEDKNEETTYPVDSKHDFAVCYKTVLRMCLNGYLQ